MMKNQERLQKIKEKRLLYGVTLRKLSGICGIAVSSLSGIENGKRPVSKEMLERIEKALERLNPDAPLEILVDYVRIRFPTSDINYVLHEVLHIRKEIMIHEDFGWYGYSEHYVFGDIFVMADSMDEEKGVLLELKGRGCRQFESYLIAQERSWFDFFRQVFEEERGVFKRLDLAINDRQGILNIPQLKQKCDREECVSRFRNFKYYSIGELKKKDEKTGMGNTLYIGSMKSDVYFCIYEKDYEQYVKLGKPVEESDVKNRFEIRLKNDRAYLAVEDLLCYRDAFMTAYGIINRYVRFVDREEGKERRYWNHSMEWDLFLNGNTGDVRLTMKPEPYTLEKTKNWIAKQVAPSLKLLMTLDDLMGVSETWEVIENARLTKKQKQIIRQQTEISEDIGSACI